MLNNHEGDRTSYLSQRTVESRYYAIIIEMLGGTFGLYLRKNKDLYTIEVGSQPTQAAERLLQEADLDLPFFRKCFKEGVADLRFFSYTHECGQKPNIHLGGDLTNVWGQQSKLALQQSVATFIELFPRVSISSGPTSWKDDREG